MSVSCVLHGVYWFLLLTSMSLQDRGREEPMSTTWNTRDQCFYFPADFAGHLSCAGSSDGGICTIDVIGREKPGLKDH